MNAPADDGPEIEVVGPLSSEQDEALREAEHALRAYRDAPTPEARRWASFAFGKAAERLRLAAS